MLQTMNQVDQLLQIHHLNRTPVRVDILKALTASQVALSEKELRAKLSFNHDRSTLYRNIKTFLETGIIHSVMIDGQDVRYAISNDYANSKHYHPHFHCGQCDAVVCLNELLIQQPTVPEGFQAEDFNLVINGKCPTCKD
jgi:Fur family ferric uptake transcriptional regulator